MPTSTRSSISTISRLTRRCRAVLLAALALGAVAGCATMAEPEGPPRKENVFAVTQSNRLISFNAGQPARILGNRPLTGLAAGEKIVGIDYRVARGLLYGLGAGGQLYLIDAATATAKPVGGVLLGAGVTADDLGFDFNPTVDRIRLVTGGTVSSRIHPETGALVDANPDVPGLQLDGRLFYTVGDVNAGKTPRVQGAAYSYNKVNEKITTNYAIDAAAAVLVTQEPARARSLPSRRTAGNCSPLAR